MNQNKVEVSQRARSSFIENRIDKLQREGEIETRQFLERLLEQKKNPTSDKPFQVPRFH
jgi:hypothetical protein